MSPSVPAAWLVVLGLLGARPVPAHWDAPEAIAAAIGREPGVERVACDEHNPRVLFVRVGPRWYEAATAVRAARSREWAVRWRHGVAQGIVAVLDAGTDVPVVRFGRRGEVAEVRGPPTGYGKAPLGDAQTPKSP